MKDKKQIFNVLYKYCVPQPKPIADRCEAAGSLTLNNLARSSAIPGVEVALIGHRTSMGATSFGGSLSPTISGF